MMPRQFVAWLTLPVALVSGCSSMSNTESGAAGGGLFGAGAGAIIGHATGHTGAGAVLGAGIGALTGGLIGHAEDQAEKKVAAAHAARMLGVTDIVQMSQASVSDGVIISQIRSTGSVSQLSANDTIWLKQQGVSDGVVRAMLATSYGARWRYRHGYATPVCVAEPIPTETLAAPAPAATQPGSDLPPQPVPVN